MQNSPSSTPYGTMGLVLHWGMAALMLATFIFGQYMEDLPRGPEKLNAIGWHLLLGMSILMLMVPRVIWRVKTPALPQPEKGSTWQKRAAEAGHGLLYLLMMALPVTGFLAVTSVSGTLPVLGLFELPGLLPSRGLHEAMETLHGVLSKVLVFTVIAHLLATGWHHFVRRDDIAGRMLPFLKNAS